MYSSSYCTVSSQRRDILRSPWALGTTRLLKCLGDNGYLSGKTTRSSPCCSTFQLPKYRLLASTCSRWFTAWHKPIQELSTHYAQSHLCVISSFVPQSSTSETSRQSSASLPPFTSSYYLTTCSKLHRLKSRSSTDHIVSASCLRGKQI